MIRSELVARIVGQNPHLCPKDCAAVVATILKHISAALAAGDRVEIRGFGTLSIRWHEDRLGRNPRSGAAVEVIAKNSVHFKPGKEMRERLHPKGTRKPGKSVAWVLPAS